MKTCTKCGEYSKDFPKRSASKDGFGSICKRCVKSYKQRLAPKTAPVLKRCTRCTEIKKPTDFYRHRYSKDGLHQWCKSCDNVRAEIYRNTESGKASIHKTRKTTSRFSTTRSRVIKSGMDWNLSKYEYYLIVDQPCHYCRASPLPGFGYGISRIDTLVGFTKDNCVPSCKICNKIRSAGVEYEQMHKIATVL